jgi:hypothetical protein
LEYVQQHYKYDFCNVIGGTTSHFSGLYEHECVCKEVTSESSQITKCKKFHSATLGSAVPATPCAQLLSATLSQQTGRSSNPESAATLSQQQP